MKSIPTVVAGLALASSWTWVIGMYLPRVLLERYGWLGFFIFAIPNVLGCAAFGRVLGRNGASDELRQKVSLEARWFSSATIAFHLLFAVFLFRSLLPEDGFLFDWKTTAQSPVILLVIAFAMSCLPRQTFIWIGASIWCFSMFVLTTYISRTIENIPTEPPVQALYLLPLTAAGFLLCPYLDLTFHEVRRNFSKQAFDVFGVAFSCMLGLTIMLWMTHSPHLNRYALLHLTLQSLFTVAWHLGALRREESDQKMFLTRGVALPLIVAISMLFFMSGDRQQDQAWYLRFLFLYGGLFPAAFLLRLKYGTQNTVPALIIFAVITAIPGELSFIKNQPAWALVPFVALLVCGSWQTAKWERPTS